MFTLFLTFRTSTVPFYEDSTVKIISAPAITQMNGQIACVTAMSTCFSFFDPDLLDCSAISVISSSINCLTQRYFDTSAVLDIAGFWLWAPAKELPSNESFSVLHQLTSACDVPTIEDKQGFNKTIESNIHASPFHERGP